MGLCAVGYGFLDFNFLGNRPVGVSRNRGTGTPQKIYAQAELSFWLPVKKRLTETFKMSHPCGRGKWLGEELTPTIPGLESRGGRGRSRVIDSTSEKDTENMLPSPESRKAKDLHKKCCLLCVAQLWTSGFYSLPEFLDFFFVAGVLGRRVM